MNVDNAVLSLIGIGLALVLFIVMAFRGVSILIIAPLMVTLVGLMSGVNVLNLLAGPFMNGFVGFAKSFFLIFALSAIFGKLVGDSGVARSVAITICGIARKSKKNQMFIAVLSLPLINSILTYSGISLFVVVFTLVTIARSLFKELNVPWHLYCCGCLGTGAFTLSSMPGTPALQNLVPIKYFGTTPMAAPILGIFASIVMVVLGIGYIYWQVSISKRKGEGFMDTGSLIDKVALADDDNKPIFPMWRCLLPLVVPIIVMNVFKQSPVTALVCAVIATYLIFYRSFSDIKKSLNDGISNAVIPMINVCAAIGFGTACAAVSGFDILKGALDQIPGSPLIQMMVAIFVASAVTGSGTGGMGLVLETMSKKFIDAGIDPQLAHRFGAMAALSGAVPNSGAVINTLAITRLTHAQAYKHYFSLDIVIHAIGMLAALGLAQFGVR